MIDTTLTPCTLRSALNRWWRKRDIPADLLERLSPDTRNKSAVYRSIDAFEHLHDIAWDRLTAERQRLDHPPHPTPQTFHAVQAAVQNDFSVVQSDLLNQDLAQWSAVYHRYLAPVRLRHDALASLVGMSERSLHRLSHTGLKALIAALIEELTPS